MSDRCLAQALSRRNLLRYAGVGLAGVLVGAPRSAHALPTGARADVEAAAREYGVPAALLLAMAYVNTRLEMPAAHEVAYRPGDPERRGVYGPMALERNPGYDTVGLAARLTGVPAATLMSDRAANLRGGAALLAYSQGRGRPGLPRDWLPALAGHGGEGPAVRATAGVGGGNLYVEQVSDALARGFSVRTSVGEDVALSAQARVVG